jgi:hypothetical protein
MANLFAITGSTSNPALPEPFDFPTTVDTISVQGKGTKAAAVSLTGTGWQVVPSVSFGSQDNILASVSAASPTDAWAVGAYYESKTSPLATLGHHFDGTAWTAFPLPNVGVQQNTLLGVSMPAWEGLGGRFLRERQLRPKHVDRTLQWRHLVSCSEPESEHYAEPPLRCRGDL